MSLFSYIGKQSLVGAILASTVLSVSDVLAQNVNLPPPKPGSFFTAFDFIPDGRLVIFTGTEVRIQTQRDSSNFNLLGTLPAKFRGGSDPAFVVTDPAGSFFVLSTS